MLQFDPKWVKKSLRKSRNKWHLDSKLEALHELLKVEHWSICIVLGFWLLSRYIGKNNQIISELRNRWKKPKSYQLSVWRFLLHSVPYISCLKKECNYQVFLVHCYYFRRIIYILKCSYTLFISNNCYTTDNITFTDIYFHIVCCSIFLLTIQKYHLV